MITLIPCKGDNRLTTDLQEPEKIILYPRFDIENLEDYDVALQCGNRPLNEVFDKGPYPSLDLHGMILLEAEFWVSEFLDYCVANSIDFAVIITGKGRHSHKRVPRLRPLVKEMLEEMDLFFLPADGEFYVLFM